MHHIYNFVVNVFCCVVYHISQSCGHIYIGQIGRCLNVRVREHYNKVGRMPPDFTGATLPEWYMLTEF